MPSRSAAHSHSVPQDQFRAAVSAVTREEFRSAVGVLGLGSSAVQVNDEDRGDALELCRAAMALISPAASYPPGGTAPELETNDEAPLEEVSSL